MSMAIDQPGQHRVAGKIDYTSARGNLRRARRSNFFDLVAAHEDNLVMDNVSSFDIDQPARANDGQLLRGSWDEKKKHQEKSSHCTVCHKGAKTQRSTKTRLLHRNFHRLYGLSLLSARVSLSEKNLAASSVIEPVTGLIT